MALTTTWKGQLKISLVSFPVRLYTAVGSAKKLALNQLLQKLQQRDHLQDLKKGPSSERARATDGICRRYARQQNNGNIFSNLVIFMKCTIFLTFNCRLCNKIQGRKSPLGLSD